MKHELEVMSSLWATWAEIGINLPEDSWETQTRLSDPDHWTVKTLYSHHSQTVHRLYQFSDCGTSSPPEHENAGSFFDQFNERESDKKDVSAAAHEEAEASSISYLISVFHDKGPEAIDKARTADATVIQTDEGSILFRDYVRNRICESVVHLLDIHDALGTDSSTIPLAAISISCDVILEMTDRVQFLEFMTGRQSQATEPAFRI